MLEEQASELKSVISNFDVDPRTYLLTVRVSSLFKDATHIIQGYSLRDPCCGEQFAVVIEGNTGDDSSCIARRGC